MSLSVESNKVTTTQETPQEEVVKPYEITFNTPDEKFQSTEFYKVTTDGERVDMTNGWVTNYINSNEKWRAKIIMVPDYELGGIGKLITKDVL